MNTEVVQVIERAAELITAGWCKGVSQQITPQGVQFCLVGALCEAAEGKGIDVDRAARAAAWEQLRSTKGYETLPVFNDAPETSREDVLDLLARAANQVRGQR